MKKALLTCVLLFGTLCISFAQRYQETVDYMESSAIELPFTHQINTTPFVADLKLASADSTIKIIEITEPFKDYAVSRDLIPMMPTFKAVALTEAVKKLRAGYNGNPPMAVDVILGVLFDVRTIYPDGKGMPGRLSITVSGYPARYANFRTAKEEDIRLIKSASQINTHYEKTYDINDSPDHKATILKENIQILK